MLSCTTKPILPSTLKYVFLNIHKYKLTFCTKSLLFFFFSDGFYWIIYECFLTHSFIQFSICINFLLDWIYTPYIDSTSRIPSLLICIMIMWTFCECNCHWEIIIFHYLVTLFAQPIFWYNNRSLTVHLLSSQNTFFHKMQGVL